MFQSGSGSWRQYRSELNLSESDEINLHFGKRDPFSMSYEEAMAGVTDLVVASLVEAQRNGRRYVMFNHGSSTSRRGKTTARSQVRNFMRSTARDASSTKPYSWQSCVSRQPNRPKKARRPQQERSN
jgi:hypothetical protein